MTEPIKKPIQTNPESYKPKTPKMMNMLENHMIEKLIKTISYEGVDFEIVERPDVKWVGSLKFNEENFNADPSPLVRDVHPLWNDFFEKEVINNPNHENFIAPTAIGVLWFNMKNNDLPNGMMMAKEIYTATYDSKFNLYTQPAGLYIRLKVDADSAQLIGKEKCEPHELHKIMAEIAKQSGYEIYFPVVNGISLVNIEYHDSDVGFLYTYLHVRKENI